MFDALIEKDPCTEGRLSPMAYIVHDAYFESAIVKLQRGNSTVLSLEEQRVVSALEINREENDADDLEILNFAERALKRQRKNQVTMSRKFIDARFILATSNVCERLFSKVDHTLTDRRCRSRCRSIPPVSNLKFFYT